MLQGSDNVGWLLKQLNCKLIVRKYLWYDCPTGDLMQTVLPPLLWVHQQLESSDSPLPPLAAYSCRAYVVQ